MSCPSEEVGKAPGSCRGKKKILSWKKSVAKYYGFMVWDNDAGPLVNHWDEEESRAQDGHQEEGPKKHSIQNLGYKLPILDHLKEQQQKELFSFRKLKHSRSMASKQTVGRLIHCCRAEH